MTTEVRIVLATLSRTDPDGPPQQGHIDLAPAVYDLDVSPTLGPRLITPADAPDGFADYLDGVMDDMLALSASLVNQYADEWATKEQDPTAATSFSAERTTPQVSDLYVRLLVDFADKHPELLTNMLTALLVDSITSTGSDPDTRGPAH